jgi:hypothetical protein
LSPAACAAHRNSDDLDAAWNRRIGEVPKPSESRAHGGRSAPSFEHLPATATNSDRAAHSCHCPTMGAPQRPHLLKITCRSHPANGRRNSSAPASRSASSRDARDANAFIRQAASFFSIGW